MKNNEDKIVPVVLVRHAQSEWNRENRFTGWADPQLTDVGFTEAKKAGELLQTQNIQFDFAFSSSLRRSQQTLAVLLAQLGQSNIDQAQHWQLNERHYGVLQGQNKDEAAATVGEAQVWRWRRGYHDRPASLARTDRNHPQFDARYQHVDPRQLPDVESLAETRTRVMQFWQQQALPRIQKRQRLLISAHGNSLRALIMALSRMTISQVERFEIPTATPIFVEFNRRGVSIDWRYLDASEKLDYAANNSRYISC